MGMDVDHGLGDVYLTLVPSDPAIYTIRDVARPLADCPEIADLDSRKSPV
jgi:hypothetical protein